jgi:hypothetical protein
MRCLGGHHLDGAAGQAKQHRPHGICSSPINKIFKPGGNDAHFA